MPERTYIRQHLFEALWSALTGEPRLLQVVTGPRQVGKTTIALQVQERWRGRKIYETADRPHTPGAEWISNHWKNARALPLKAGEDTLLILDEVQKIPHWSEAVKVRFSDLTRHRLGPLPASLSEHYPPASRTIVRHPFGGNPATAG